MGQSGEHFPYITEIKLVLSWRRLWYINRYCLSPGATTGKIINSFKMSRYSAPRNGGEHTYFSVLECVWYIVTSKVGSVEREGGKVTLWWRNITNTASYRWSVSTSTLISHGDSMYPWWQMALYLCGLRPQTNCRLSVRKTSEKPQQGDIPQNTWPVLLKAVKVIKTRHVKETASAKRSLRKQGG